MKRSNLKTFIIAALTVTFLSYLNSCSEGAESSKKGKINVSMTDSIAAYLAVNVDVESIRVQVTLNESEANNDSISLEGSQWYELNTYAGIYNLLDFRDGIDTLLAHGEIPLGFISQIRLVLGENNSIVTLTDTFPLNIPSGSSSGFKILVNQELNDVETLELLFDFDAGKSVVITGNGEFLLKPVLNLIKTKNL